MFACVHHLGWWAWTASARCAEPATCSSSPTGGPACYWICKVSWSLTCKAWWWEARRFKTSQCFFENSNISGFCILRHETELMSKYHYKGYNLYIFSIFSYMNIINRQKHVLGVHQGFICEFSDFSACSKRIPFPISAHPNGRRWGHPCSTRSFLPPIGSAER